jgi:hypothetical protein
VSDVQFSDGCIERWAFLRNTGGPITPAELRQLARQCTAAADEIELLSKEGI